MLMLMTNQLNEIIKFSFMKVRGWFVVNLLTNKRLLSFGLPRPRLLRGLFGFILLAGVVKRYFTLFGWLVIFALIILITTLIIL